MNCLVKIGGHLGDLNCPNVDTVNRGYNDTWQSIPISWFKRPRIVESVIIFIDKSRNDNFFNPIIFKILEEKEIDSFAHM